MSLAPIPSSKSCEATGEASPLPGNHSKERVSTFDAAHDPDLQHACSIFQGLSRARMRWGIPLSSPSAERSRGDP